MSSGPASYSVSATNYGRNPADAYYALTGADVHIGPLTVTGNFTVEGTTNLEGAVTMGAALNVAGAITAPSAAISGAVSAASVAATGAVTAASVAATGDIVSSAGRVKSPASALGFSVTGSTYYAALVNIAVPGPSTGNINFVSAPGGVALPAASSAPIGLWAMWGTLKVDVTDPVPDICQFFWNNGTNWVGLYQDITTTSIFYLAGSTNKFVFKNVSTSFALVYNLNLVFLGVQQN